MFISNIKRARVAAVLLPLWLAGCSTVGEFVATSGHVVGDLVATSGEVVGDLLTPGGRRGCTSASPCSGGISHGVSAPLEGHLAAPVTLDHVPSLVGPGQKITVTGHGAPGSTVGMAASQQRLMAMRAAKVDAYRSLAEQVYGFKLSGGTSVSSFAAQNDQIRAYVDTFIRGARVVSMTAIADGNYEATVELDLPVTFFDCLGGRGNKSCSGGARRASAADASCGYYGCLSQR